jgi:TatD DNase family protein
LRRLFGNKLFIISVVLVLLFVLAAMTAGENSRLNVIRNVISVPLKPLQTGINAIGGKIKDTVHFFKDIRTARAENAELKIKIREMSRSGKVVAIGEVGLDYHYDFSPRETQRECFAAHIGLAGELKLPLIIHDRDAHKDVIDIIKSENANFTGGVFHCFPGSIEMAREVLDAGFYISLGGTVTFKNARKPVEVAKYIPIDRLLVETDSPYMTPVPHRGKRNDSGYLPLIVQKIAEIRNMKVEQVTQVTTENTCRLFNLRLSC